MASEKPKQNNAVWAMVWRIFGLAGGLKAFYFMALGADLLQVATILLSNHYLRKVFDAVTAGQTAQFWQFVTATILIGVAGIPISYARRYAMGRFGESTLSKIRGAIASQATQLPMGYLEERHSGDLLSVLNADLAKLKKTMTSDLLEVISQVVRLVAAFTYIMLVDWKLTLVTTLLTPLIFLLISALSRPISSRTEEMQKEIGQVNSIAQDSLAGLMVAKSFNLIAALEERFQRGNRAALKKGYEIARLQALIDAVGMAISITPFIIAIGMGGYLSIIGQITFGSLFAFINLLNYVVNPLGALPGVFASLSEASGAAQRIFKILDEPKERQDGSISAARGPEAVALRFDRVGFAYDPAAPVLRDLTFEAAQGKTTAIVGPSGGGKSTLLKLVLGYYPPQSGKIELMGAALQDWNLAGARRQMAFVAQDSYLFPVSIAENIRTGKPDASQAEIEQAARLANIHDFIASLPEGYHTLVGERGARLSGGQKQRISLARAILRDAPILLLDEATSALDTESEALVQSALERFSQGRTTLVIAHRLSTIRNADRVVVLDDGGVVEEGTHEELIARSGLYLDLYQKQFAPGSNGANGGTKN